MREERIFQDAVKIESAEERSTFLENACGSDAKLRQSVEALLRHHHEAGSFLEKPAEEFIATVGDECDHSDPDSILEFLGAGPDGDSLGQIGQYEITETVGRGGMGIVLKGQDPKLNRVVAIKVLSPQLASNVSARKRFLREGQAAAAISHDHVVTIFGIDDTAPLPFIAMEYINGPSLQQRIDERGALELKEILRIGKQAAAGLAAAHAEGLVHRDIKPSNLLLENGVERVKITDFGLARAVDDVTITKPGTVTGTPEYMSPEQARSEPVDHRSDLFSLGCVLYAMCTGRPPFRAENTAAIIRRICDDQPRPIREVNSDIPVWLANLVEKLLAKDPDQRFQSAADVADLLGRGLAHVQHPDANPRPPVFDRLRSPARRWLQRRGRLVTAACAVLIGLLGVGFTEATGITQIAPSIIEIFRNDGTLIVHVDDPNIQVLVDGEELVITGAGPQEFRLRPGDHEFQAIRDGKPVQQRLVTIHRGGEEVVRVEFQPSEKSLTQAKPVGVTVRKVWEDAIDVGGQPSPDGRFLSYVDWSTGDLTVRDLRTGASHGLTNSSNYSNGFAVSSCFSPDGQQLAYSWYNNSRTDLRVVGVDGTGERVIYQDDERSFAGVADWSSDGRYLLGIREGGESRELVTVSLADGTVRVLKSLSRKIRQGRTFARFSPDVRHVAFDWPADDSSRARNVFLLDLDSGAETVIVEHPSDDGLMGWAPDGSGVAFHSNRRGTQDVWFVPVVNGTSAGDPAFVKADLGSNLGLLGFTQDGSYYYAAAIGRMNVYVGDLDLDYGVVNDRRFATQHHQDATHLPDWSPDGTKLAYIVEREPGHGSATLILQTLQTQDERAIPINLDLVKNLRWSPDGRQVLVIGRFRQRWQGVLIDVDSGQIADFPVHQGVGDVFSIWSADSSSFYYRTVNRDAGSIVKRDATTGTDTAVYAGQDYIRALAVSRQGAHIAFAEDTDGFSIRLLDGSSGQIRELTTLRDPEWIPNQPGESLEFTPDGRNLLFVKILGDKSNPDLRELWSIPVAGGQPLKFDLAMTGLRHPRVHPDGRRIAFTAGVERQIDVWVIENFLPNVALAGQSEVQAATDVNQPAGIVARQVWAPAADTEGGPSPDGKLLSFVDWQSGNVAVRDLVTGENRQVSTEGGWKEHDVYPEFPVFSPDGTQLACCWYDGEQGTFDLRIINLDGSPPRVLFQSDEVDYLYPNDWSDDGKFILTLMSKKHAPDEIALVSTADGTVATVTRDGRWPHRMSLSPDGRYIVHDAARHEETDAPNIHLITADGTREVPLVESDANDVYPVWCPDGEHVLFFSDRTGSMSAWTIRVVDGAPVGEPSLVQEDIGQTWPMGMTNDGVLLYSKLTDTQDTFLVTLHAETGTPLETPAPVNRRRPGAKTSPRWSQDWQWMSYFWHGPLETDPQRTTLVVRSVATGQEREVLIGGRRIDDGLFWSPDSRQMALRWLDASNTWHIGVVDVQTGVQTSLLEFEEPSRPLPPRWLDDGKSLLFRVGQREGGAWRGEWRRYDLESGESSVVPNLPGADSGGLQFIDDNTLVFGIPARQDGTQPVRTSARNITHWRMDAPSGQREQIITSVGYARVSPDRRQLAYVIPGEPPAIGMVPIAGGETRVVYQFPAGAPNPLLGAWTVDGAALFFSAPVENTEQLPRQFALWRLSTAGDSPPQKAAEFEQHGYDQRFIIRPDGGQVAFTAGQDKYEVWTLENFLPP